MKIVYMGTPEFAVPALEALHEDGHEIRFVVTQPDKARDRGKKVQFPPVKQKALEYGLEILQPEKLKQNEEFLSLMEEAAPDLIVVAAYGKILPVRLLEVPKLGCINIHASLLPKYRGAAPIHRSIINGESETGITLMYMEEGLDTGDMIASEKTAIEKKTTALLHDELAQMGAALLIKTLPEIQEGTAARVRQNDSDATYAPMVFKQDGLVDFSKNPTEIENLIRGLNSWPGAYTLYRGQMMKLWEADVMDRETGEPPGTVLAATDQGIEAVAGGKTILITKIQMPGKKPVAVKDYLKGNRIEPSVRLGE